MLDGGSAGWLDVAGGGFSGCNSHILCSKIFIECFEDFHLPSENKNRFSDKDSFISQRTPFDTLGERFFVSGSSQIMICRVS